MSWFQVADGRLRYRGRIDRQPFAAWGSTKDGTAAINAAAGRIGFRLLGRKRAARRLLWRNLERAARTEPLRSALQTAADDFGRAICELAYAPGLPRLQVALRRVVVLPRAMAAGKARAIMIPPLLNCGGLADVDEAVRAFFADQTIVELDAAIQRARPSPARPVHAPRDWACVGIETEFAWVDPYFSGPGWFGHLLVFEWPPAGISRRDRKELEHAVDELQRGIRGLSREQRHAVVKAAVA